MVQMQPSSTTPPAAPTGPQTFVPQTPAGPTWPQPATPSAGTCSTITLHARIKSLEEQKAALMAVNEELLRMHQEALCRIPCLLEARITSLKAQTATLMAANKELIQILLDDNDEEAGCVTQTPPCEEEKERRCVPKTPPCEEEKERKRRRTESFDGHTVCA